MGDLRNSEGLPTGAAYNFTNMIRSLLEEKEPEYLAVVFDPEGSTFRKEMYEEYKANRDETPEELVTQIPYVEEILDAMGVPRVSVEDYEADDVIATLATQAREEGDDVVLVSSDKDLTQLVGDRIHMFDTMRDRKMDEEYVLDRYDVRRPDQMVDYLAMVGDSSDNIPGISGIGKKSASKLLQQFDSMEEALEHPDQIDSTRIRNAINDASDEASLYKDLIRLRKNAPVDIDLEDLTLKERNTGRLRETFKELEFNRLLEELPPERSLDESTYNTVTDLEFLDELIAAVEEEGHMVLDLETSGLDPFENEIIGFALALPDQAFYVPTRHTGEGGDRQLDHQEVVERLKPVLASQDVTVCGQNLKFDLKFLMRESMELNGISCDTLLVSYVLQPSRSSHGLDALARTLLDHSMTPYDEVVQDRDSLRDVDVSRVSDYACEDVTATREIAKILLDRLDERELVDLYREIEEPLIQILAEMELTGIRMDPEELENMREELNEKLAALENEVWEEAGREFNLNSPQQMQEVLFEDLGLEPVRKTKTGYSTDADTLRELADEHPVPSMILEHRSLSKLVNTYANKLPELVNEETGRLHTEFHQTRTETGRLSSSEPNLQNIPVRSEEGRRIREAFVAEEGWRLLSADYSQVELRVLAHVSGDQVMTDAFRDGRDIHSTTAADMFDVSLEEVDEELRETAKTINFGIVYGISAYGLAQRLDIEPDRAQTYIDQYLERYSGVKQYMDEIVEKAREDEYVTTLRGRRRDIPEIHSDDYNTRSFAERTAINTPIQGSAADLIKIAMIDVYEALNDQQLKARLVLQIHDELVLEVPEREMMKVKPLVEGNMSSAMDLDVPLEVEMSDGKTWADVK